MPITLSNLRLILAAVGVTATALFATLLFLVGATFPAWLLVLFGVLVAADQVVIQIRHRSESTIV